MATNKPASQQNLTNFQIIEPLFYKEFNTIDPIFPEWTLERMPRNVNTNRLRLDKNKMVGKWFYETYNTKGRFRCVKCIKSDVAEKDATWSSAYTTILFRAYYGPDTDEYGQVWIGGWIQMKIFAQGCKECHEYMTGELTNERPQHLVKWLHRWIANKFYGFHFSHNGYRGQLTNRNHLVDLCEACAVGCCLYRKRHDQLTNPIITE
ncbi:unnamed protein product [Rotaria sp. Silwood1]|nr:unnamed protein product [Rotaria sp. Silwood1]CAF1316467.1 unnamed protein product [Rotaria sp. Silwood1]CAF3501433.1 unnamed protein product [Rotaria sp. Silwood1]CAF3536355.1 unnamed protein product [Rotaria sp. Silwood1]CAF4596621.1 unnamed protein product [Rotaria sp. Silwood1]